MIDQLAGHWVEGVKIQATGFPPPNVEDYHLLGLIPNISACIRDGLWVRHVWNRGVCETAYVSRYIAYGTYSDTGGEHVIGAIKARFPGIKAASFSNWDWDVFDPQHNIGPQHFDFNYTLYRWLSERFGIEYFEGDPPSQQYWERRKQCKATKFEERREQFDDHGLLYRYAIPWMRENQDWKIVYMHWVDHDGTAAPAFVAHPKSPYDDKHHHLTDYVDRNVGELVEFLKSEGFWEEMVLILFSDHGYHLNCDAPESREFGRDFCSNHAPAHDCFVWNYEKGKATTVRSDCCRRTFIILSGGVLPVELRGQQIEKAEVIDVPATIADIFGIQYGGDGVSVLPRV